MDTEGRMIGLKDAAAVIKDAIIRSRYQAVTLVNKELLSLYYAVGRYISQNSRNSTWGQGVIRQISDHLQRELPGLRGFSEASIKRMRSFYEGWQPTFTIRPSPTGDLTIGRGTGAEDRNDHAKIGGRQQSFIIRPSTTDDLTIIPSVRSGEGNDRVMTILPRDGGSIIDLSLLSENIRGFAIPGFSVDNFFSVGFTHHSEILAKEKSLDGRLFYITQCAVEFWSVETLRSKLRGELYSRSGTIPNNFLQTLPGSEMARRAMRAFKDEYVLDFINIEDENDPDERVIERGIIANIKQFILSFGDKFCFIGNQYRIVVDEKEFFIDLLFFNRELRCLVAVELKRGEFRPAYLGQLNFYLSALDEYIRQPDECRSIGIILCKEANRNIVEFAVRDYTKPMGVATYRTKNEMPEEWRRALPDLDDMRKLLESVPDRQSSFDRFE